MFSERRGLRFLLITGLVMFVSLLVIGPALAGDVYSDGETVVIDQDADDDVYVTAQYVTVNATIDGDLIVFAEELTLNGTVTGDVLFGGKSMILNGEIQDDLRAGGAVILLEGESTVGDDVNVGGYTFEMRPGSTVGGDVFAAGQQTLINDVAGDLYFGGMGVRIDGVVGGNANLAVSSPDAPFMPNPMMFMGDANLPPTTSVPAGVTFGSSGEISGDLNYASDQALDISAGNVGGAVEFTDTAVTEVEATAPVAGVGAWATLGFVRYLGYVVGGFVMLLLTGLLLQKLAPDFLDKSVTTLKSRPWASLGYGFLGFLVVYVVLPVLFVVLVVLVILPLLGAGGWLRGGLTMLSTGFWLVFRAASRWVAPVLVGFIVGGWLLALFKKEEKSVSPIGVLALGLVVLVVVMGIPFFGRFLLSAAVGLFGLGAILLTLWPGKKPVEEAAPLVSGEPEAPLTGPEADKPTE